MATIVSKRGEEEAIHASNVIALHGLEIRMRGTTVRLASGSAQVCEMSRMHARSHHTDNIGLCTILRDPYNLIPLADGVMIQDVGRYLDSCAPGSMIPQDAPHLADPTVNPIARFLRAQLAIHTSELALVFPREIMRVGFIGDNYYISHAPIPAQHIAHRARLRMTDYVVRMSRAHRPARCQVERAFRELFSETEQPADLDMIIPPHATRAAAAATPSDEATSEDEEEPIVAKEFKE